MERKFNNIEHQLPSDLKNFLIEARQDSYVSGREAVFGKNIVGFKGYVYYREDSPYYYEDNFIDKKTGVFGGFEIIRKEHQQGARLFMYTYGGGLTDAGLELGEEQVYGKLRDFLNLGVDGTRLGVNVLGIKDGWRYQNSGKITQWGWQDHEAMTIKGRKLYEFSGTGLVFV